MLSTTLPSFVNSTLPLSLSFSLLGSHLPTIRSLGLSAFLSSARAGASSSASVSTLSNPARYAVRMMFLRIRCPVSPVLGPSHVPLFVSDALAGGESRLACALRPGHNTAWTRFLTHRKEYR